MSRLEIDHVQLAAPKNCESVARQFYGAVLGLKEIPKPEALIGRGGCWFRVGERQLHIGVEKPFRPSQKAHLAFASSDLVTIFEQLCEYGVACTWDEALAGVKRFYAADPWGNRLEFTEPTHCVRDFAKNSLAPFPRTDNE